MNQKHLPRWSCLSFADEGRLQLVISHSTQKELEHKNTPSFVKREARARIFTLDVPLTQEERAMLSRIELILAGNGTIENVKQDARHLFEAQKYGSYFITTDKRALVRRNALARECTLRVATPCEFLALVQQHASL